MRRLALLVVPALLLAGCGETEAVGRTVLENWSHEASDLGALSRPGESLDHFLPDLKAEQRAASSAAAIDRAIAADIVVTVQFAAADAQGAALGKRAMIEAALEGALAHGEAGDTDPLRDATHEVLSDVACDLVFKVMTPDEQSAAKDAETSQSAVHVADLVEPTADAIESAALKLLAGKVSPGLVDAINWVDYGKRIVGDVTEIVPVNADGTSTTLSQQVVAPDWVHTRAYYEYARLCLKPPE